MKKRNISILSLNKKGCWRVASFPRIIAIVFLLISIFGNVSCEKQKGTGVGPQANSPPVVSAVRILPEKPIQENELTVSIESQDPDGDPITYDYQWMKNDEEISGANKSILKNSSFKKNDLIRVKVTPSDEKGKGNPFLSSPVKILNSPPIVQETWIEPKVAFASDQLKAFCKSEDKDGDFVYFTYQWEKNGVLLSDEKSEVLERGQFKKGDSITVAVTPDDREVLGNPKKSSPVIISNSPPIIVSSPPSNTEGSTYLYQVKVNDPDDDAVTFTLKSGPKGMKIDKNTGLIQWEIGKEDKGVFPIEVEASDNEGAKSLQRYTLTVESK